MNWTNSRERVWPFGMAFSSLAAALTLMIACTAAHAETRVALVIGNGNYKNANKLVNPRNDATDVAAALKRDGFETIVGLDLDKAGMDDAEIRFERIASHADVAIFYYSGHAIQYATTNYLLPVDAELKDVADLRRLEKVDDIISILQLAQNLRIIVLDSCRDNPLADELKQSLGATRSASVERGLARLNTSQKGMIVAYSTQAGKTADDGQGRNSPYTTAFLNEIEKPEEISTVFRRIAANVERSGKQLPELSLSYFGDFYLRDPTTPAASSPADAPIKQARLSDPSDLITDCDRLASSPIDPQRPPGVSGVAIDKIEIVPSLSACNSAMAQHPEIARFPYQAGRIAGAQKDYVISHQLYEKASALGSAAAMNNIGALYNYGTGVTQDYAEARKWYEKASAAGLPFAAKNIGALYEDGQGVPQDYAEARKWYEKAAALGSTDGMMSIGQLYAAGHGVPQDYTTAKTWYEKAAAAGEPNALVSLGDLYYYPNGITKDYAEAKKWFQKAADAGSASGMWRLGEIYHHGYGVSGDNTEARKWYEKSAAGGYSSAFGSLGGLSSDEDKNDEAKNWWAKGVAAGDANSMYNVARDYDRDRKGAEAQPLWEKAAAAGIGYAMVRAGEYDEIGDGGHQDFGQAQKWYEKAAAAGDASAMAKLGFLYETGNGGHQDIAAARKWYQQAATAGDDNAKSRFDRLAERPAALVREFSAATRRTTGDDRVNSVAYSPDGKRILSGAGDGSVRLWDLDSGKLLRNFKPFFSFVYSVAFSPDGNFVIAGGQDGVILMWDATTGDIVHTIIVHAIVNSIAFSPDGKSIVSASADRTVRLWSAASGDLIREFKGHTSYVVSVAFSPDGSRIISGSYDKTARLWDVTSGKFIREFRGHGETVDAVAFTSDGRRIASAARDSTIRIWDVASGSVIRELKGRHTIHAISFLPNETQIMASGGGISLWSANSGAMLQGYPGGNFSMALSPDKQQMISGDNDGHISVWNVASISQNTTGTPQKH